MTDLGHRYADKVLSDIDKEFISIFSEAIRETDKIATAYMAKFEEQSKKKLQELADGKITEMEYKTWLQGRIFQKNQYNTFVAEYIKVLNKYDAQAISFINTKTIDVFAVNANYIAYSIETGQKTNFGFALWDKTTVEKLIKESTDILPPIGLSIDKNTAWNQKAIRRQLTSSILQGESVDKLAKRLQKVTEMNMTNARRNARTAITGSQNSGRKERAKEAVDMGLKLKLVWIATKDNRTRDTHRAMDGQEILVSESFVITDEKTGAKRKIQYPGEAFAEQQDKANCRCSVREKYEGITGSAEQKRLDTAKTKEYVDWRKGLNI